MEMVLPHKKVVASAPGRAPLLGNPSDVYGGKVISMAIKKRAFVTIENFNELTIEGNNCIEKTLSFNGKHDLVKACIKRLHLENKPIRIKYRTQIPFRGGLGGSAAICVAALGALREFFDIKMDDFDLAETATSVEMHDLRIVAGQQDRYISVFGGLCFMDFSGKEFQRENDPYGKITLLNATIPIFAAIIQRKKTASFHNKRLREKFLAGETAIKKKMDKLAQLAVAGRLLAEKQNWHEFGKLMSINQEMVNELYGMPSDKPKQIIKTALKQGAFGARVCGGNASTIILADEKAMQKIISKFPEQEFLALQKENAGLKVKSVIVNDKK